MMLASIEASCTSKGPFYTKRVRGRTDGRTTGPETTLIPARERLVAREEKRHGRALFDTKVGSIHLTCNPTT